LCRASKAALNIINKAMVMDLTAKQIECVLMHPGYVKTDMTGAVAAEVAATATLVCVYAAGGVHARTEGLCLMMAASLHARK
jgi:NAD(P)-dependent dehydrogenase (short-subunit alcohol dehydrogenase family)